MISLVSIMLNEELYVRQWATANVVHMFDQVLVVDGGSSDATVDILHELGINVQTRRFDRDFSAQRNYALGLAEHPWVLELDADEVMSLPFRVGIREIIANAERDDVAALGLPRLNFIDDQLVASPGHRGLDFQYRLHRRELRWRGRVHEELDLTDGNRVELELRDGHFLIHDKSSARHHARNAFYEEIAQ